MRHSFQATRWCFCY
uniref:Uncharacterized protein n=1 Tax=Arundo donax TaxID=35708 RepID=A0A0A9C7P0_ARUDO